MERILADEDFVMSKISEDFNTKASFKKKKEIHMLMYFGKQGKKQC